MTIKLLGANDASGSAEGKDFFILAKFTAVASGNMTEFRVKSGVSGYVKCALYADNAGEPGALITAMNTGQAVTGSGWETLSFTSTPIVNGTVYWLAIQCVATGGTIRYKSATYSSFTFPDPAGSGFSSEVEYILIAGWGTITAAAGRSFGFIIG
jgi:hypothetical protein